MDSGDAALIERSDLVVCDFDGTLAALQVDWHGLKARLHDLAAARGEAWAFVRAFDADLRKIRERKPQLFAELCDAIAAEERAGFDAGLTNRGLIEALRARGDRPLAVFSANTRRALGDILLDPVWKPLRPFLVAKEDVRAGKPDPEGLRAAQEHFGVSAEKTLYLGDAPQDREAALRAGVRYIHVRFSRAAR